MSKDLSQPPANPFELSEEEMRQIGYRVVDYLVSRAAHPDASPPINLDQPDSGLTALRRPPPDGPQDPLQIIEPVMQQLANNSMNLMHPRFFAYMPGPGNFISTLAEFIATGLNVFAGTALNNRGPFEVERATIDWLGSQFGWNFANSGLFVSGGSAANLTSLAIARHVRLQDKMDGAVVYTSDQTHSCIERSMYILGFRPDQLRLIEAGPDMRLDPDRLEAAVRADREAGRRPFLVVGNGGTTNTGAVDPLDRLAEICRRHELWFHVDAAYGGGAILSAQARPLFQGIEHADTIAMDPHKWMFQPYECACVLGREAAWFSDTFRRVPAYMRDTDVSGEMFNYRDMGPQVTRSFKALKLWLSLQVYGVDRFRQAVDIGLDMARYAESIVRNMNDWEVVTPAKLGVLTCRHIPDHLGPEEIEKHNASLATELNRSGFAYVTTTELNGRTVLRFCPIHPALTHADLDQTFAWLNDLALGQAHSEG